MDEQLRDIGAVLGYRPDLKFEKPIKGGTDKTSLGSIEYVSPTYSSTVQSFINNTPSNVLSQIDDSMQKITDSIKRMIELFKEGSYEKYQNIDLFVSGLKEDSPYSKEFLSYHYNNIEGSQVPEIIELLSNEYDRLTVLSKTLKKLYYGNSNISTTAATNLDNDYISLITSKEYNKEVEAINYLTIANDTKLNKTISSYLSSLNACTIDLEDSLYKSPSSDLSASKVISNTISSMFKVTTSDLTDKKEMNAYQQEIATMEKALYNYYGKRRELKSFYDVAYTLNDDYLSNKTTSYTTALNDAITNVDRTIFGSTAYLSLIQPIEVEKQYLREVYNTINYKP